MRMSWLSSGSDERQYCACRLHQVGPWRMSCTVAAAMSKTINPHGASAALPSPRKAEMAIRCPSAEMVERG